MATMIFVVVLTLTLAAIVAVTAWSAGRNAGHEGADDAVGGRAPVPAQRVPETLEGVLARQLLEGEITAPQYRRAVQRLAERDADRHPLSVPAED